MSVAVAAPKEPLRLFSCPGCGISFQLSSRAAREADRNNRQPICRSCRYPSVIVVTDAMLDWWTNRFSEREIVEIAESLWGPRDEWSARPPQLRL